jgi:hypothetical protein
MALCSFFYCRKKEKTPSGDLVLTPSWMLHTTLSKASSSSIHIAVGFILVVCIPIRRRGSRKLFKSSHAKAAERSSIVQTSMTSRFASLRIIGTINRSTESVSFTCQTARLRYRGYDDDEGGGDETRSSKLTAPSALFRRWLEQYRMKFVNGDALYQIICFSE